MKVVTSSSVDKPDFSASNSSLFRTLPVKAQNDKTC